MVNKQIENRLAERGFESSFDYDAIVISLNHIDDFSSDPTVQSAIENKVEFYVFAVTTPYLDKSRVWNYIIDPKVKKVDGSWYLHGRNIRIFEKLEYGEKDWRAGFFFISIKIG